MATTKIPVRENTGNLEILPKHTEFGLLKLNSLILKVKDISKFAAKISHKKLSLISLPSRFMYVIVTNHVNWHREKFSADREKTGKTQGI